MTLLMFYFPIILNMHLRILSLVFSTAYSKLLHPSARSLFYFLVGNRDKKNTLPKILPRAGKHYDLELNKSTPGYKTRKKFAAWV